MELPCPTGFRLVSSVCLRCEVKEQPHLLSPHLIPNMRGTPSVRILLFRLCTFAVTVFFLRFFTSFFGCTERDLRSGCSKANPTETVGSVILLEVDIGRRKHLGPDSLGVVLCSNIGEEVDGCGVWFVL